MWHERWGAGRACGSCCAGFVFGEEEDGAAGFPENEVEEAEAAAVEGGLDGVGASRSGVTAAPTFHKVVTRKRVGNESWLILNLGSI